MKRTLALLPCLLLFVIGCNNNKKNDRSIIGKWTVVALRIGGEEKAQTNDPSIEFRSDNSYTAYEPEDDPKDKNGDYLYTAAKGTLTLWPRKERENGNNYTITWEDDKMIMKESGEHALITLVLKRL